MKTKLTKKQKEKEVIKRLSSEITAVRSELFSVRSKISALEKELVSALEEHGRALTQRNHAEQITQSFYEAIRRVLVMVRR